MTTENLYFNSEIDFKCFPTDNAFTQIKLTKQNIFEDLLISSILSKDSMAVRITREDVGKWVSFNRV